MPTSSAGARSTALSASSSCAARRFADLRLGGALLERLDLGLELADLLARLRRLLLREESSLLDLLQSLAGGGELPAVPPAAGRPGDDGSDQERDRDRDREHACLTNVHAADFGWSFDELERAAGQPAANVRSST